jgi:hypothetical protein
MDVVFLILEECHHMVVAVVDVVHTQHMALAVKSN